MGKKEKSKMAAGVVSVWRTPFQFAVPMFLWTILAVLMYYTSGYFREVLPFAVGGFPELLQFSGTAIAEYAKGVGVLVWLLLLGAGSGFLALSRVKFGFNSRTEAAVLSLGLGWGGLGLLMLVLGLAGLWYKSLIIGILLGLTIPAMVGVHRLTRLQLPARPSWSGFELLLACALCYILFINSIGALAPNTYYDVLIYHLALPELYLMHHGIIATQYNLYSGLPMQTEMLYTIGLLFGSETAANLIHMTFGFMCMLLILSFFRRHFRNRLAGLMGALIYYSTLLVSFISWKSCVELSWSFFQLAAVYSLAVRAQEGEGQKNWTWLGAVYLGFAMGAKYVAWPALGVLAVLLAIVKYRELPRAPRWWREPALFALLAVGVLALWPAKNMILYGNPVYPFLHERFASAGEPVPDWKRLLSDGQRRDMRAVFSSWSEFRDYLEHPWTVLSGKYGDFEGVGVAPLLVLPFLLFFRSKHRACSFLLLATTFLWLAWSFSSKMTRFFIPQLPLVAAVLVCAMEEGFGLWQRRIAYAVLLFAAVVQQVWTMGWFRVYQAGNVMVGLETRDSYLSRFIPAYPQTSYPAIDFINKNLPGDAKVLFLGESRGFRMQRDYVAATVLFDKHPLVKWLTESRDTGELMKRFREAGITHMLFNRHLMQGYRENGSDMLAVGEREKVLMTEFETKHLRKIFEKTPTQGNLDETWVLVFEVI